MPQLEIAYSDGRRERIALSRATPLSLGSQSFNDVTIPGEDVAAMHCRIGWNKSGYEVTAATSRGIVVNSVLKQHAFLRAGDVLQIGACDINFLEDQPAASAAPGFVTTPKGAGSPKVEESPRSHKSKKGRGRGQPVDNHAQVDESQASEELLEFGEVAKGGEGAANTLASERKVPASTIARELQGGRQRPGEQEVLKSPFILSLLGGSGVLLLIAGTLWLLLSRETSAKLFEQAEQDLRQAKFAQAIEQFEEYQARYPQSARTPQARLQAATARVQKEMSGAAPVWGLAEERLQQLIREFRNTDQFSGLQPTIRAFAEEISLGAATAAGNARDERLLAVSASARQLLERAAGDEDLTAANERIRAAVDRAESLISRQKLRDAAVVKIQSALSLQKPIDALAAREQLLRQLPEYRSDREIQTGLDAALKQELAAITVTDLEQPAATTSSRPELHSMLPLFLARSRTTDSRAGQNAWVLAQDCCYAVDIATGEVVWRRVIGSQPPFAPVTTRGAVTGWLLYSRASEELIHVNAKDGSLIWRQELPGVPAGGPLVNEGQIYLCVTGQRLLRLDLDSGELTAEVSFSQPVQGPPVLDRTASTLLFAGQRGLIYAVQKRPLSPLAVTFTDHAAGAVSAPLTPIGRLLLLSENDRANSARLRVWNAADPAKPLPKELEQRVDGQVWDAPVLRGAHLVIPLLGERLAAFVMNDADGRAEMTPVGTYRIQDGYRGPLHVVLGPDQQFWLSSTAFRRFEIGTDSLRLDSSAVAMGLTAQPLQLAGETFYVGRRSAFAEGVQFTNIDRQSLSGSWRTVVGARPIAGTFLPNGDWQFVTESGFIGSLSAAQRAAGGIVRDATIDLEWPVDLPTAPLATELAPGQLAVAIGGQQPRWWSLEGSPRNVKAQPLTAELQRPPVFVGKVLVFPMAGRLQFLESGQKFEDWRLPAVGDQVPRWSHLTPLTAEELLAIDDTGRCRRMQIRRGEIPHLAEVAAVTLASAPRLPPLVTDEHILLVDSPQRLQRLNARTLEVVDHFETQGDILGFQRLDSGQLLLWDQQQIYGLELQTQLKRKWVGQGPPSGLIGRPLLVGSHIWMGCRDGTVVQIERETGQLSTVTTVGQELSLGLVEHQSERWAVACDGTMYRLPEYRVPVAKEAE